MPELPEVEHVRRGLEAKAIGEVIIGVTFSDKVHIGKEAGKETIIKGIELESFRVRVIGSTIQSIDRRSKYLIFTLENEFGEQFIISHLGMSGAYFVVDTIDDIGIPNYINHWHVEFELQSGKKLIYSDIRRFGELRLVKRLEDAAQIMAIAPEPFEEGAEDYFIKQLTLKKWQQKKIKEAVMNHSVISGCGNIYACEGLHAAAINPHRLVKDMTEDEQCRLFKALVVSLEEGIYYGGSSISSYRNVDGERGQMQTRFKIYGRQVCGTCGREVERAIIAGRNTHYCTYCQK